MEITLRYNVTRKDISRFYWRLWRTRLWKFHLGIPIIALFFCIFLRNQESAWAYSPLWVALFVICCLLVYPQVQYKSQTRILIANDNGIHTAIGTLGGSLGWADVMRIDNAGDAIYVIRTNLDPLIIPNHAFSSVQERTDFLQKAEAWLAAAVPSV